MRKIKRTIVVRGVKHDIWLGLVKKGVKNTTAFQIFYYTGNANDPDNKPIAIKGGIRGEKEAIQLGMDFMKEMMEGILDRNK